MSGHCAFHSLSLSSEVLRQVQQSIDVLYSSDAGCGFNYPWNDLEDFLASGNKLYLAGYGSLLNWRSAERTFHRGAIQSRTPVVVFQARRVFDYVMSSKSRLRYQTQFPDSMCGVLNSYLTEHVSDFFNAMLFELSACDLAPFREREFGYDLLPVITRNWDPVNQQVGDREQVAYILSCRRPYFNGRQMTCPEILPHPEYHALCKDGCRDISPEFLRLFEQTTYCCNRQIVLSETDMLS